MNLYIRQITLALISLVMTGQAVGQRRIASYERYIDTYSNLAIQQEKKYNIPASITLAQALLESGAGLSRLAKEANNHFGIKCHKDWKGKRSYHDDDKRNECFRKYKSVIDSYEDHSLFLAKRSRYESLFRLSKTDYRGWAKGLQKCGYATNRAYANQLIKLIEDYELYVYDKAEESDRPRRFGRKEHASSQQGASSRADGKRTFPRDIYKTYGLIYTIARYNDSFHRIAEDLGFKEKDLARFNEVPKNFPLRQGDIVYLEKKKKRADKPHLFHQVQIGESMHSISQYYGIRVKSIYKLNNKDGDYVPMEGETLKIR